MKGTLKQPEPYPLGITARIVATGSWLSPSTNKPDLHESIVIMHRDGSITFGFYNKHGRKERYFGEDGSFADPLYWHPMPSRPSDAPKCPETAGSYPVKLAGEWKK